MAHTVTETQEPDVTGRDCGFVKPVAPPALSRASATGRMDDASRQLRDCEWRWYIRERRRHYNAEQNQGDAGPLDLGDQAPDDLAGLALSGGGIRSATFALGVLQALAHHDLLRRFDYLSTVSGGGYIGTSLTWLTSRQVATHAMANNGCAEARLDGDAPALPQQGFGLGPSDRVEAFAGAAPGPFPYGSDDPRTAREPARPRAATAMLRYLRQHGNYLTPGEGITLTSIVVVLLRGFILNQLVWVPILAALMWSLILVSLHLPLISVLGWLPASAADLVASMSPPLQWDAPGAGAPGAVIRLWAFGLLLAAAIVLFAICVLAFVAYSLITYRNHGSDGVLLGRGTKYCWRRHFEQDMRYPLWVIGPLLLIASVPFVAGSLHGWLLGSSFSVVGLASGLVAFVRTMQQPKSRAEKAASWAVPSGWIASFGAAFLLYGVLLVAYAFGWWAHGGRPVLGVAPHWVLLVAVLLALTTGWVVDLNLTTIHRFYRDRLMEAFLPDVDQALRDKTAPAREADVATLSSMCDPRQPVGPYHLVNTNLVLTKSNERTYRLRGGDSFVLSPLYCGSNATGWQPTAGYMGDELTLPTAMAISGAAANPWTASGGVGVTRNPLVGMLMALMNLRLGFWVPNPNDDGRRRSCQSRFRANHFEPGLKEVVGASLRETSRTCLLSDGGHFDNLGLYELIRRRLRLILVCDGTADPDYAFADLQNALARIAADFGARVEFDQRTSLQCFMPSVDAVYPRGVRLSESAYAVAQITYSDGRTGHLVYLTTTLCKGLRLRLLGYKGAHPDFPDQSTADQFFDEEQFEAYRELGYVIADDFIRHDMQNGGMLGQSIRTRFYPHAAE